jgi:hypothetical protein
VTIGIANLAYNMRRFVWLKVKYGAAGSEGRTGRPTPTSSRA